MNQAVLFAGAVTAFAVRDARLLSAAPPRRLLFAGVLAVAGGACGAVAETLSREQAEAWLTDARFWTAAVTIHGLLAAWSRLRAVRGGDGRGLLLVPSPLWLAATVGFCRLGLESSNAVSGMQLGALMGAAYAAAAIVISRANQIGGDPAAALRFAALTHWSAVLLIPAGRFLDQETAARAVDPTAAAVVLTITALVVLASFALHRRRSKPTTASKSR